MIVWQRIDATVQEYYRASAWKDIPVHGLMVSGAQQALYAVMKQIEDEEMASIKAGRRPRPPKLRAWLRAEIDAMLAAEKARCEALEDNEVRTGAAP